MRARSITLVLLLSLVASPAFAKKKPAPEPAPTPAPEPAPVVEEPPPAPAEPPPPRSVSNANFNVTLTFADGTTRSGHVKGVERSEDYSALLGWTDEASKLKLNVEASGSEKAATWADVKGIAIVPGKIPDEVDCAYSSETTPWTYDCTLRTVSTATLKDGYKGTVSNRHHWRFTFDDGSTLEFQVYKYQVKEQDDRVVEPGEDTENRGLYTKLQDQIRQEVKTKIVKSITVN